MIFTETKLRGVFLIDLERVEDSRGFFARTFCAQEFESRGLKTAVAQCNLSYNRRAGTLRGMHYQIAPATEAKLVRCTRGSIFDVVVDMRPTSPTFKSHVGVELSAENRRALYVPEMFAHGFLTLTDDAEVLYQMSEFYAPGCGRGVRYDDPSLGIRWPLAVTEIAEKDKLWPLLEATPEVPDAGHV